MQWSEYNEPAHHPNPQKQGKGEGGFAGRVFYPGLALPVVEK
jgi:hypothetical protein